MGIFKFANASIRVNDLGQSLEFYRDIIGLHEIATDNNTIYLAAAPTKHTISQSSKEEQV